MGTVGVIVIRKGKWKRAITVRRSSILRFCAHHIWNNSMFKPSIVSSLISSFLALPVLAQSTATVFAPPSNVRNRRPCPEDTTKNENRFSR
jgi:hypothetical protein